MPSLRDFSLKAEVDVDEGTDLDAVLHSFTCPSLVRFNLHVYGPWTVGSFEIIKQQYNIQGLEELELGSFPLSISSILQSAPMLRTLSVQSCAILDDAAIIGISSGTLGRFLTNLDLGHTDCDVNEVVRMVETRMKTVNQIIGNGCSWKDEITILRDVTVCGDGGSVCQQRIDALEKVGINFTIQ